MKKYLIIPGLFLILILSGCGSSARVFHDMDPSARFDQYKTYSFLDWTDGNMRTVSEIERENIRVAMAREIELMGLSYQEENPDLKIEINVYFRSSRSHYHYRYGYPGRSLTSTERALTTDIFEGTSKKHIWHSAAVGIESRSQEKRAEELPELMSRMFEDYPGKKDI